MIFRIGFLLLFSLSAVSALSFKNSTYLKVGDQSWPGTVVVEDGNTLKVHTTSDASSTVVTNLPNGANLALYCKMVGTEETGSQGTSAMWFYVNNTGFASAAYIKTSYNSSLPECPAPPPPPDNCQAAIDYAKSHLGSPYMGCAGGEYRQGVPAPSRICADGTTCGQSHVYCEDEGDVGFDCSGLMYAMWKAVGEEFPCTDSSTGIHNNDCTGCSYVDKSALQPCDMLAKNGHVVMYIGGDQVIQSSPEDNPVNGVYVGTQVTSSSSYVSSSDYVGVRCPV